MSFLFIESDGDPTAVGDNGCSFGIFQAYTCGGEGDGYPQAVLENPTINAQVVMPAMGEAMKVCGRYDYTCIARNSQRPANVESYGALAGTLASKISGKDLVGAWDTLYTARQGGNTQVGLPLPPVIPPIPIPGLPGGPSLPGVGDITGAITSAVNAALAATFGALIDDVAKQTPAILVAILGLGLVIIGAVSWGKSSPTVRTVAKVAALA